MEVSINAVADIRLLVLLQVEEEEEEYDKGRDEHYQNNQDKMRDDAWRNVAHNQKTQVNDGFACCCARLRMQVGSGMSGDLAGHSKFYIVCHDCGKDDNPAAAIHRRRRLANLTRQYGVLTSVSFALGGVEQLMSIEMAAPKYDKISYKCFGFHSAIGPEPTSSACFVATYGATHVKCRLCKLKRSGIRIMLFPHCNPSAASASQIL